MNFPSYFPDGCPPQKAIAEELEVFRAVTNDPLSRDDFRSYHELGIHIDKITNSYYAVSCFTDETAFDMTMGMPAKRSRFRFKAKGITSIYCGVIYKNARGHVDWWLYDGAEPEKHFSIVSELKHE